MVSLAIRLPEISILSLMSVGLTTKISTAMGGCFAPAMPAGPAGVPEDAVWLVVFLSELPQADRTNRTIPVRKKLNG